MINSFRGIYFFLSNFYPCTIVHGDFSYPTLEHAFQSEKTLNKHEKLLILRCDTPGQAKRMGHTVKVRTDWETIKFNVMKELLIKKFSQEPFKTWIKETGEEELIEGNFWHDNFWGNCYCDICKGRGNNMLGKLLMEIRNGN